MDILTLIMTNYPETVSVFLWLVIFALSAASLLMMVEALNHMTDEDNQRRAHRQWRSETKEFYERYPELDVT